MDMARIDDWLSAIPSKYTRKTYRSGIKKFEEFYRKPIEGLLNLSDEETGHNIEKFYAWLKQKHPQNTCRNLVNCPIQYLKYFGKNPKYRKSLGMYRTVLTTRDHLTTINEVQEMAKVSDLREQILLEVFLCGLRVRDVSLLEWKTFAANGEPPIPILINTKKEDVVARVFISEEFKGLLNKYLETMDKSNPYLFQSKKWTNKRKGIQNLGTKQIENIFKGLVKKAGIENHGVMAWHTGRKLVSRTCAELGISSFIYKMFVGKAIPMSDATYLQGTEIRNDFVKLNKVLRLFPETTPQATEKLEGLETAVKQLETENMAFKTRVDLLQKDLQKLTRQVEQLVPPAAIYKGEITEFHNADEYIAWHDKTIKKALEEHKEKTVLEREDGEKLNRTLEKLLKEKPKDYDKIAVKLVNEHRKKYGCSFLDDRP